MVESFNPLDRGNSNQITPAAQQQGYAQPRPTAFQSPRSGKF